MEEHGAEDKGADGDQDGGGDDEDVVTICVASRQGREEFFDLRQVGERADVEAQIHELQQDEERLHNGVRGLGKLFGGGQDCG